jgi:hypothetical protein
MEPALPPAGNPDDEDELTLVREPLGAGITRPGVALRPLLRALSLALAIVLVLVAAGVILQRQRPRPRRTTLLPLATSTPTTPLTPAPILPTGQGWTPAGPAWAQWIVFAPSDPRTAYICGTPTNKNPSRQGQVMLGLSLDSGRTWQMLATAILASDCQVDVDPTDAHDLLLQVEHCTTCSTPNPAEVYRSVDSGRSWHLAELPPPPGSSSVTYAAFQWVWQGSTLFIMPLFAGTQLRRLVAISVAEGPFVWVNQNALLAGVPAGMQLNDLYANTTAVYADFDFYAPSNCSQKCTLTKVSADLGATWSNFQPRYQGQTVYLLDQQVSVADGYTLIGQVVSSQDANTSVYVTSSDGGARWTPMPLPPGDLVITALVSTPSGISYAETWSFGSVATAPPAVYRLSPGASTWVLVGALPGSGFPLAVSWAAQGGYPLALWSVANNLSAQTITTAGPITHAP